MLSIATVPWAAAVWASIILPVTSPTAQRWGKGSPPTSTRIWSSTGMKPRSVSTPSAARFSSALVGTRPVATSTASTSRVSTSSLVPMSASSIVTGQPGVTLRASKPARASMSRPSISLRAASLAMSGSKVGITRSRASIIVTSQPRAVYTSANSRPM